jgi:hypothetical protein
VTTALACLRWVDVARQELGADVSQDEADYILWNHTGFPHFWDVGVDGDTPEQCCRTQLRKYVAGECECPDCEDERRQAGQ